MIITAIITTIVIVAAFIFYIQWSKNNNNLILANSEYLPDDSPDRLSDNTLLRNNIANTIKASKALQDSYDYFFFWITYGYAKLTF